MIHFMHYVNACKNAPMNLSTIKRIQIENILSTKFYTTSINGRLVVVQQIWLLSSANFRYPLWADKSLHFLILKTSMFQLAMYVVKDLNSRPLRFDI